MSKPSNHFYDFGSFRIDPIKRRLLRDGEVVSLTPKAFDTLLVLLERRGQTLTKDELMQQVWQDVAVEENNLTQNISTLRKVLGEGNGNGQYIVTIPKQGYRFVAEVTEVGEAAAPDSATDKPEAFKVVEPLSADESQPPSGKADNTVTQLGEVKKRKLWVAMAAATLIAVVASVYYLYPKSGGDVIESVAVLPFVNDTGDPNTEYLPEGISDSIINSLSRLPNLKVISLNTALHYKGKQVDPQAVGRELNVQAVLTGKMTQRGDGFAISAELVDVRDNRHLWGGQYNGKPSDILVVQQKIAGEIAEKLCPEKQRLTKQYTENADAYEAYLRGSFMVGKRTGPAIETGIQYLEKAIKLDPNYALAYADLGFAYWSAGLFRTRSTKEALPKAKTAVAKAMEIDDALPAAYTVLGHIRWQDWDWKGAEIAYKRGIELNPNSGRAHSLYSHYLITMRRFDEGVAESKRAVELEPLSHHNIFAINLYMARRYDEAIEQCLKTLELNPLLPSAWGWLASCYQQKGLYDKAVEAYSQGSTPAEVKALREAYARSGWKGFWRKALDLQKKLAKQMPRVNSYGFAETYVRLGENDQAFAWLEREYEQGSGMIKFLPADPVWDPLRSDPRYADIIRRMGLEP